MEAIREFIDTLRPAFNPEYILVEEINIEQHMI